MTMEELARFVLNHEGDEREIFPIVFGFYADIDDTITEHIKQAKDVREFIADLREYYGEPEERAAIEISAPMEPGPIQREYNATLIKEEVDSYGKLYNPPTLKLSPEALKIEYNIGFSKDIGETLSDRARVARKALKEAHIVVKTRIANMGDILVVELFDKIVEDLGTYEWMYYDHTSLEIYAAFSNLDNRLDPNGDVFNRLRILREDVDRESFILRRHYQENMDPALGRELLDLPPEEYEQALIDAREDIFKSELSKEICRVDGLVMEVCMDLKTPT